MEYHSVRSKSIPFARFIPYARFYFFSNIKTFNRKKSHLCKSSVNIWFCLTLSFSKISNILKFCRFLASLQCKLLLERSTEWTHSLKTYKKRKKVKKWGKKFRNLLKKYSICEILLFHMRGDLCSKNFGLQQKYSICEYSICGVLLYCIWVHRNRNTIKQAYYI